MGGNESKETKLLELVPDADTRRQEEERRASQGSMTGECQAATTETSQVNQETKKPATRVLKVS